jgi:LysM repeat protein
LDKEVLESMSVKVDEINSLNKNKKKKFVYEVKEGETLFTISQKYNIPVKDIQRINNLNDFDIYEGQIIVLTESKESDTIEPQISKIEEEPNTSAQTVVDAFDTKTTNETTQNDNVEPYTVKEGETLFSIAKDKNIKIEDLKTANNLITNDINVGDVIDIPLDKINEEVKETVIETPVKTPVETVAPEPADNKQYHIVQPKETLYRIHINYGVSIKKLRKLNKLKGNYIKVGQKLRIK